MSRRTSINRLIGKSSSITLCKKKTVPKRHPCSNSTSSSNGNTYIRAKLKIFLGCSRRSVCKVEKVHFVDRHPINGCTQHTRFRFLRFLCFLVSLRAFLNLKSEQHQQQLLLLQPPSLNNVQSYDWS